MADQAARDADDVLGFSQSPMVDPYMATEPVLPAEYACVGTFSYATTNGIWTVGDCHRPATEIVAGQAFCHQCAARRRIQIDWSGDLLDTTRYDGRDA